MHEAYLKSMLNKLKLKHKKTFYNLANKIYFQNNKKSLSFLKVKFEDFKIRKIFYQLLKLGLIQPFLKKVELPDLGQVIFVGEQIKIFDLENRIVYSFPGISQRREVFIKSKKEQRKMGKEGYAPKIIKLNTKVPYSVEEFIEGGRCKNFKKALKILYSFYEKQGIHKISFKKYLKMKKVSLDNKFLSYIYQIKRIYITTIHGDFAKENTLIDKKGNVFFIDWNLQKDLIIGDLVNFFRNETDFLKNKDFLEILKIYPKEVQNNIREYLLLFIISRPKQSEISKKRIKNILKYF